MDVIKTFEKDSLIFGRIENAGFHGGSAHYEMVYDKKNKRLHIYDDRSHTSTSIINNRHIKHDVLEALGYSDGFIASVLNRLGRKEDNHQVRFFIYQSQFIWEISSNEEDIGHPYTVVEDETLLYEPYAQKVWEHTEYVRPTFYS